MPKSESEITWKDVTPGCVCEEPGSASLYKTGPWRSQRPTYQHTRCIKCGLCQLYCPEGCIHDDGGYFEADFDYCKGCGICARECWPRVITMVDEEE